MNWKMLAARDAIRALVPFQPQLRKAKRRVFPYRPNEENFSLTFNQGLEQIALIRSAGRAINGTVVEIGAGWLPIIPLLYKLSGARHHVLLDLERLMDENTVEIAKDFLRGRCAATAAVLNISAAQVESLLAEAFSPDYRVPGLVEALAPQSADLVVSRAVLEHVKPAELDGMLRGLVKVLRPDGLICFTIDNSDHWQHRDKSICRVNFLKYDDDWRWQLASLNRQNYQNRLRHSDYAGIFRRFGFEILAENRDVNDTALKELRTIRLAKHFKGYAHDDLATMTSVFLLRQGPKLAVQN